jgi:hypothetical protein
VGTLPRRASRLGCPCKEKNKSKTNHFSKFLGIYYQYEGHSIQDLGKKNFPKKITEGPCDIFSTRSRNFTRASRTKVDDNKGHNGAVRFQLVFTFDVQVLGLDDIAIFGLYAARMCAWVENVTYLSGFGDTKGV